MEQGNRSTGSFFSELRRRRVIRTCLLYIVLCWGGLQVADIVVPALGFDGDTASRYFLYAAVLGFPVTFALAWFFQITTQGIVRTETFVERRVLNNIPPINDRRRSGVSTYFRKGEGLPEYHWIISAETGPLSGLSFGVAKTLILGRALECDLAIVTPHVSRQHAQLDLEDDQLYVEDLGSSNGTMVNGRRAVGRQALHHEDELRFHDIIFRVTESFSRPHSEKKAMDQTTFIHAAQTDDASDAEGGPAT
jgi:hypothetical protein